MTISKADEFIKISIHIIRQIHESVPFDIYVKRAEGKYTKLFHKLHLVDHELLQRYQNEKGIKSLYVHNNEHKTYRYYVEKILELALQEPKKSSPIKLSGIVAEMSSLAISEIYVQTGIDTKVLNWADKAMRGCVKVLSEDPKALIRIIEALKTHPHTFKHSMMTALFSMMLSRKLRYTSEKSLLNVGMGGLLHDIGLCVLPMGIEFKEQPTPQEWKSIKEHPQIGYQMLETLKSVSSEVRTIVMQHHERMNGCGYPNNTHGQDIFTLSKLVAIADNFTEKIIIREINHEPISVMNALALMNEDQGHFDPEMLKAFSNIFSRKLS